MAYLPQGHSDVGEGAPCARPAASNGIDVEVARHTRPVRFRNLGGGHNSYLK